MSVVSNSVRPHRQQPTRIPRPWDSPGKNTGVGCHFLLQCMKVKSESEVVQSCPTLSDPMDCSLPGSSIHGIFQARVLEWGAIAFSTDQGSKLYLLQRMCGVLNAGSPGSPCIWTLNGWGECELYLSKAIWINIMSAIFKTWMASYGSWKYILQHCSSHIVTTK